MESDSLSPPALVFLAVALLLVFTVPRDKVIFPVLVSTVLMTIGQSINILGANFYFLRIVIIAAWLRLMMRGQLRRPLVLHPIDKAFILYVAYAVLMGFVPKHTDPRAVMPPMTLMQTIINKGGVTLDSLGAYFLARQLFRSMKDVMFTIRVLIIICIVLACFMTVEKTTGRNLFSAFGVVPEYTVVRDGHLRCQGPFTHPIHAGDYGATLMVLCAGLWLYGQKSVAFVGFAAAAIVTVESSSSGPLLSSIYGLGSFLIWPFRFRMHVIRRSLVLLILILHVTMTSPVWWAISRVAEFTGGGGYWRSKLIDEFVEHTSEWFWTGSLYTAHWSPTGSGLPMYPDHMDLTNQYVAEGVHGGIGQIILYILIVVRCFTRIGLGIRSLSPGDKMERFYWALGCCLVAYLASFLSVAGSMQSDILYFTFLAFIATIPLPEPNPTQPAASADSKEPRLLAREPGGVAQSL
ncbi:MAG TPA: hypothetical protein VG734_26720 [Lacunisphaera sp.]|nr:hypothetical protein [Lacunisphaera sp.]